MSQGTENLREGLVYASLVCLTIPPFFYLIWSQYFVYLQKRHSQAHCAILYIIFPCSCSSANEILFPKNSVLASYPLIPLSQSNLDIPPLCSHTMLRFYTLSQLYYNN